MSEVAGDAMGYLPMKVAEVFLRRHADGCIGRMKYEPSSCLLYQMASIYLIILYLFLCPVIVGVWVCFVNNGWRMSFTFRCCFGCLFVKCDEEKRYYLFGKY